MRRGSAVLALTLLALLPLSATARPLRTLPVRELVLHADTVVLAEPLEQSFAPTRFKVLEVMRGRGLAPGRTLTLDDLGSHTNPMVHEEGVSPSGKPHLKPVEQALLFLGPNRGTPRQPRFQPIMSGLRFWTEDRALLVPGWPWPWQLSNPGGCLLTVHRDADWLALVHQARADSASVNRLFALKGQPPSTRRTQALLDWIARRRHEFGADSPASAEGATAGWGDLETEVFQWILEGCEPEDCWSAVRLYAELNRAANPPLRGPSFGSRAGRDLLARIAVSTAALEGDRVRALGLLGDRQTLWPAPVKGRGQPLEGGEQAELLDRLQPLLAVPSAPLRAAAARALRCVSLPPDEMPQALRRQRVLPALEKAYRAESPGEARDELAEAVCQVGGAKHWQKLTGNPPGLLVRLRDLERRDKQIHFWLNLRPCGLAVYECPTLLLERLDKAGKVVEKKQVPAPIANLLKPWAEGWDGGSFLLVQLPVGDCKPGTWRLTAQGTAGKDHGRQKWTSEPKTFVIEEPKNDNGGGPFLYK